MNWKGANDRRRMSRHGTEPIKGSGVAQSTDQARKTKRKASPLTEPIIIDRWWKNRAHDALYVRLAPYEGQSLLDIRVWITGSDGITKPTKGLSCRVKHLPRLHAALTKALAKAKSLGLLDDDGAGE
jgi:hypothetical protein